MFHGVHQHLAERRQQAVPGFLRHIAAVLAHEVDEPLGGQVTAGHRQRDPVRQAQVDGDAVPPVDRVDGALRHLGHLRGVERRDEARKDLRTDRLDEFGRRGGGSEHDGLETRARGAEFLQKGEVVAHRRIGVGDDDVDRAGPDRAEGADVPGGGDELAAREVAGRLELGFSAPRRRQ